MTSIEPYASALADAICEALPRWVRRCVVETMASRGGVVSPAVSAAAEQAGVSAQGEVGAKVRELLETDIDKQTTTPLALLREAVAYPTRVLEDAHVPFANRDDYQLGRFPHDHYDLSPANLTDVDISLSDPGLEWGAAKAFVHKARHR